MLALEFEPSTPRITKVRALTVLTACSNHLRDFPILRSAQYSRAMIQITSGSVSHFLCSSTLRALRWGWASDQIAIDQSMPDVGPLLGVRHSSS